MFPHRDDFLFKVFLLLQASRPKVLFIEFYTFFQFDQSDVIVCLPAVVFGMFDEPFNFQLNERRSVRCEISHPKTYQNWIPEKLYRFLNFTRNLALGLLGPFQI